MIFENILKRILSIPGFKTKRKLVIFTVDDYGSIRMPNKSVYRILERNGVNFGSCRFSKYDSLESNTDLEELYNVLLSKKDSNGNHPVFTAVTCTSNPDFTKIEKDNFNQYYSEPFVQTLEKYENHNKVYELYKKGIELNIFVPELHNREHLDTVHWMNDLRNRNKITFLGFENNIYSLSYRYSHLLNRNYQVAFSFVKMELDIEQQISALHQGTEIFENLFGYKTQYFTPPNGTINYSYFKQLSTAGIKLLDVARINKEPVGENKFERHFHYLGQTNRHNQRYLVRNCVFEPSGENIDSVSKCINMISAAFTSRQPAIISSHRVNFAGYLYPENRIKGLRKLNCLIDEILKKWPDAEFISIRELYSLMEKNHCNAN